MTRVKSLPNQQESLIMTDYTSPFVIGFDGSSEDYKAAMIDLAKRGLIAQVSFAPKKTDLGLKQLGMLGAPDVFVKMNSNIGSALVNDLIWLELYFDEPRMFNNTDLGNFPFTHDCIVQAYTILRAVAAFDPNVNLANDFHDYAQKSGETYFAFAGHFYEALEHSVITPGVIIGDFPTLQSYVKFIRFAESDFKF